MRKTNGKLKKLSPFFIAFIALALVFLAVGLGTLGSFRTRGESYEFSGPVYADGETQSSTVTFRLDPSITETYTDSNGKEQTRTVYLQIDDIYVYVEAIYSDPGRSAGIKVRYSSSADSKSPTTVGTMLLENIFTGEDDIEPDEKGKLIKATDVLYRWTAPLGDVIRAMSTRSIQSNQYWHLSAESANIRIEEVVFVGSPRSGESNRAQYVIPAAVSKATPVKGQTTAEAAAAAQSLLDGEINAQAQAYKTAMGDSSVKEKPALPNLPVNAVSSFDTFTKSEIYSLLTIAEMKNGNRYSVNAAGEDPRVYTVESVYNTLGMDLLALGTDMFGVTPFGLRFFPMLFSFGLLIVGFFFVLQLTGSDRAAFVFSLLYVFCDLSFSLGHLGTPLTAGLFFVALSLLLVHRFYRNGMKKPNLIGALPLLFGGLAGAAAICVNGAMLIPVLGIVGLFIAGMVRQQKARRYYLDAAIEEYEAKEKHVVTETAEGTDAPAAEPSAAPSAAKKKVLRVVSEYRAKNLTAGLGFAAALILGTFILSLLCMIPVYYPLLKMYDNPAAPSMSVFTLGWKAFAGGFAGVNELGNTASSWSLFLTLFRGTGSSYAVTGVAINAVAAAMALVGVGFAIWRIVCAVKTNGKAELRRTVVPLAGLELSLVCAAFADTLGFIFLAYVFGFVLAAEAVDFSMNLPGKAGKAAKIVTIAALVLLVLCFALFAAFTFSIPLPASLMGKLFG